MKSWRVELIIKTTNVLEENDASKEIEEIINSWRTRNKWRIVCYLFFYF